MQITSFQSENAVVVLQAVGRIDSMTANQLGTALSGVIEQDVRSLVLDLGGVDYMSSAGLRELVNALKRLKRNNGDLRLAGPNKRVLEVLEMAGLDTIFLIFETSDEAVESF